MKKLVLMLLAACAIGRMSGIAAEFQPHTSQSNASAEEEVIVVIVE